MDKDWRATVHGVSELDTTVKLSLFNDVLSFFIVIDLFASMF